MMNDEHQAATGRGSRQTLDYAAKNTSPGVRTSKFAIASFIAAILACPHLWNWAGKGLGLRGQGASRVCTAAMVVATLVALAAGLRVRLSRGRLSGEVSHGRRWRCACCGGAASEPRSPSG